MSEKKKTALRALAVIAMVVLMSILMGCAPKEVEPQDPTYGKERTFVVNGCDTIIATDIYYYNWTKKGGLTLSDSGSVVGYYPWMKGGEMPTVKVIP